MSRLRGTSLRQALAALAVVAGVLVWVWAAQALWSSTVPASLQLPDIEASRFFGESFLERSATYERFLGITGLLASVTLLVVLAVYARRGHRLMRESAAGRVGTGMLLGMLGFAIVWITQVPFGLVSVWWQRRYDVSEQGYVEWLIESFIGLGGVFLFVSAGLAVAMGLAGVLRRWWWVVAAPMFVGLAALFTFVSPYMIPYTGPLDDPVLEAEARAIERVEGLSGTRVIVQDVDRFTDAPNAFAAGFGATRSVILWDTLLEEPFTRSGVRFVMAHEFAHLAEDHPLKRVGWLALFLVPASALIAFATRRRGGLAQPEAVPVALLVLVALSLLVTPLTTMVSRHDEVEADWVALETTREPAAGRALWREMAKASLTSPDPPGWVQALYGSHPSIAKRIAMTYAWEERMKPRRPSESGGP